MGRTFEVAHWERLFTERAEHRLPVMQIPPGSRDNSPDVLRLLRVAAFLEQRGVEVLVEESRSARDPGQAAALAHHAREETCHVRMLEELSGAKRESRGPGLIGVAERFITRRRPVSEQTLVSLLVEAMGIALYEMLAEHLRPGRIAEVFDSIVDDERVHADLMREILAAAVVGLPSRRIRRLRRIRSAIVGLFLLVHGLLHRKYLRPIGIISASETRARILREIERALSGIPELAIPSAR